LIDRVGGSAGSFSPLIAPQGEAAPTASAGFGQRLSAAAERVEQQEVAADSALELLASGQAVDIPSTMIELEKADIALRTLVSVRDRLVSAYEQVMNMAI
jgi:flagellar hook-basal body complex protein FliE